MAKKTFVISDTWFNRPYGDKFDTVEAGDYNESGIKMWNSVVGKKDDVYVLGGFGIGFLYDVVFQLNGRIHFLNNYYTDEDKNNFRFLKEYINNSINDELSKRVIFEDSQIVVLPEYDAVISYYPLADWAGKSTGTYCFHGMDVPTDMNGHNINVNAHYWSFVPADIEQVTNNIRLFKDIANSVKSGDFVK